MNVALWVVQALLAAAFALSGLIKVTQSKASLGARMAWTQDASPSLIKVIGLLEVAAALGLMLPGVLHVTPVLTPLAATGLALIMVGAMVTHARRGERGEVALNIGLLALAVVVLWGRFGPYPLT